MPEAIYCCLHTCCVSVVFYVCMPTFTIANMGILKRLPEAICCTCNVDVVLYCMYIPAFIVTSADISQLWVYLCYLYCRRLFVVVYKLVMFIECG